MSDSDIDGAYDVVVIGAGHAGCEAGLAAARTGARVLVVNPNLDRTGYMPCNPSIGGPGKSHIVAEVDALGGAMARTADTTALHVRLLNTSKGPAVQAIRSQQDKSLYAMTMKSTLELQQGLTLVQDEVVGLQFAGNDSPRVTGILCRQRGAVGCGAAVITAGTFLRAALIAGESRQSGGRAGDAANSHLVDGLASRGFRLRRLKTGTPPRIDGTTIDFVRCEDQPSDQEAMWLSRDGELGSIAPVWLPPLSLHTAPLPNERGQVMLSCFRTSTNPQTHALIRANFDRAPMFNGAIEGTGPRYCPSIEDKVNRFASKEGHPVFLEPEGWRTTEYYAQGLSTSLPFDVQDQAVRTVTGLERARITRYGYAVEYDAIEPSEIDATLASRRVEGLFLAGQVNGTSGYEEAAGQGLLAGLNAANFMRQRQLVTLRRDQGYIGVMVDDLVVKPFDEPYRMLTSRAEYRLLLRPETAHDRLSGIAYEQGLIDRAQYDSVAEERALLDAALDELHSTLLAPSQRNLAVLGNAGFDPINKQTSLAELMRRPNVSIGMLDMLANDAGGGAVSRLTGRLKSRLEQELRYGAFVAREAREVNRTSAMERKPIPAGLDFHGLSGLRYEARTKLAHHQPRTFGEASRLQGVTPADIAVPLVHATRMNPGAS